MRSFESIRARTIRALSLAAALLTFAPPSDAVMRATSDNATLAVETQSVAETVADGEFSLLLWVRMREPAAGALVTLGPPEDPLIEIRREANGPAGATVRVGDSDVELSAGRLSVEEWALVAVSVTVGDEVALRIVGEDGVGDVDAAPLADIDPAGVSKITIGATSVSAGVRADFGPALVRDHPVLIDDLRAIRDTRRYLAAYWLDDRSGPMRMNGPDGCVWMVNHVHTTLPFDALSTSTATAQRAAVIGESATLYNVHLHERDASAWPGRLEVVRDVERVRDFWYRSPFEDGWFQPTIPQVAPNFPERRTVEGVAPTVRRMIGEPDGLHRLMVSANSRGVQRNDGTSERSGNYANGFLHELEPYAAGVLFRPATLIRQPWFTFSAAENGPWRRGQIERVGGTDFSRFFTSSRTPDSGGPGAGLLLDANEGVALRADPAGLMTPTAPLVTRAHVLAYPGSSNVQWTPNHHTRQGSTGTDFAPTEQATLDTTAGTYVFDPNGGDMYADGELVLTSGVPEDLAVGDACAHAGGVAVITDIAADQPAAGMTTLRFAHPWITPPSPGDQLAFGPWEIVTIAFEWPGLAPADERVWRGLKVESAGDGWPVALFAFDAWNPDAEGFIVGAAGWGGNGYRAQIDESQPGAVETWASIADADVWLVGFAQQESAPSTMLEFTDLVRAALPEVEIVWLGESAHGSSTFEQWHRYILENAEQAGAVAVSLLTHPSFGTVLDQLSAGLRSNSNHYSATGADALAREWLALLEQAALPLPADLDGSGDVDASDLALLLSAWGDCDAPCPADLDGDDQVGTSDIAALIASWG